MTATSFADRADALLRRLQEKHGPHVIFLDMREDLIRLQVEAAGASLGDVVWDTDDSVVMADFQGSDPT